MEVTVILIEKDIELFKLFREYQDKFNFMLESEVFDIKRGSATVNFDNLGNISSIEIKKFKYPKADKI